MKKVGSAAHVFLDSFSASNVVAGPGITEKGQKYFVIEKNKNSNVPVVSGSFFIAPSEGQQISLLSGDRLFRIEPERYCKSSCSYSLSMGEVDISDDCSGSAKISDGITNISGSLAGLYNFNEETEEFSPTTELILNRFLDIISDDGNGTYTLYPRSDAQIYLLVNLNSGAKPGQIENWLFTPIIINGMNTSLSLSDPMNQELSFSKGDGVAVFYKVPVAG